ncbi:MAG: hypothetical protein U0166_10805 [Acidobacteriota bacterium]
MTPEVLVVGDTLEAALTALFAAKVGAAVTLAPKPRGLALTPVTFEVARPPLEAARLGRFNLEEHLKDLPASHPYRRMLPGDEGDAGALHAAFRLAARDLRSSLAEEGMPYEGEAYEARIALTEAGTLVAVGMAPSDLAVFRPGALPAAIELVRLPHDASFPAEAIAASLAHSAPGMKVTVRSIDLGGGAPLCSTPMEAATRTPWSLVRSELGSAGCPLLMAPRQVKGDPLPPDVYELLPRAVPSSTSVRLQTALLMALHRAKVRIVDGEPRKLAPTAQGLVLSIETSEGIEELRAPSAVLATGKFAHGGIASRPVLACPLTGAPVFGGAKRETRIDGERHFAKGPLGPHAAFSLGLKVDATLRPLGVDGAPLAERLHAVGSVVEGIDVVREGTGFALLSAWTVARRFAAPRA